MVTYDQYGDPLTVEDLKPCPFCGAKAELEAVNRLGLKRWEVHCTECSVTLWPAITPQTAVTFWNKRSYK